MYKRQPDGAVTEVKGGSSLLGAEGEQLNCSIYMGGIRTERARYHV